MSKPIVLKEWIDERRELFAAGRSEMLFDAREFKVKAVGGGSTEGDATPRTQSVGEVRSCMS